MILIEDIEIKEVSMDRWEIFNYLNESDMLFFNNQKITKEMVTGKVFINADNKEFCIGMSEKVQTAIGLPFEEFENLHNELDDKRYELETNKITISQLRDRYARSLKKIEQFETMSLWKKIKFLFKKRCS